ncbi:hypothetical protein N2152v2_001186 [Parachlorella kessleri]
MVGLIGVRETDDGFEAICLRQGREANQGRGGADGEDEDEGSGTIPEGARAHAAQADNPIITVKQEPLESSVEGDRDMGGEEEEGSRGPGGPEEGAGQPDEDQGGRQLGGSQQEEEVKDWEENGGTPREPPSPLENGGEEPRAASRGTVWWDNGSGCSRKMGNVIGSKHVHNMTMPGSALAGLARMLRDLKLTADDIITLRPAAPPQGAGAGAPPCVEIEVAQAGTLEPPASGLVDKRLGRWQVVDEASHCYKLQLHPKSSRRYSLCIPGYLAACWGLLTADKVLVVVEGHPYPLRVGIHKRGDGQGVSLSSQWAAAVQELKLQDGDTLVVKPDRAAAAAWPTLLLQLLGRQQAADPTRHGQQPQQQLQQVEKDDAPECRASRAGQGSGAAAAQVAAAAAVLEAVADSGMHVPVVTSTPVLGGGSAPRPRLTPVKAKKEEEQDVEEEQEGEEEEEEQEVEVEVEEEEGEEEEQQEEQEGGSGVPNRAAMVADGKDGHRSVSGPSVWWDSGDGCSRKLGPAVKRGKLTMPAWVMRKLRLEPHAKLQVFHPTKGWFRWELRADTVTSYVGVGLARVVKDLGLDAADVITLRPAASPAGAGAGAGALPCLGIEVAPRGTVEPPGLLTSRSLGRWTPVDEQRGSYQLLLNPGTLLNLSVPGGTAGWPEVVREHKLQAGDTITLAPDPQSATKPALLMTVSRGGSAHAAASEQAQQPLQAAEHGADQRTKLVGPKAAQAPGSQQEGGQQAMPAGGQPAGVKRRRASKTPPLRGSRRKTQAGPGPTASATAGSPAPPAPAVVSTSAAGPAGRPPASAGRPAKRARHGDSSTPGTHPVAKDYAAAVPGQAPSGQQAQLQAGEQDASLPQQQQQAEAQQPQGQQPPLQTVHAPPPPAAPQMAGHAQQAWQPAASLGAEPNRHQMLAALRPLVRSCGKGLTFLRLFMATMARDDQLDHYETIMELQDEPGEVRAWVEGWVDHLQQKQS